MKNTNSTPIIIAKISRTMTFLDFRASLNAYAEDDFLCSTALKKSARLSPFRSPRANPSWRIWHHFNVAPFVEVQSKDGIGGIKLCFFGIRDGSMTNIPTPIHRVWKVSAPKKCLGLWFNVVCQKSISHKTTSRVFVPQHLLRLNWVCMRFKCKGVFASTCTKNMTTSAPWKGKILGTTQSCRVVGVHRHE